MIHLTIQQLSTYLDGELSESSAALVRQHFGTCEACARKYAGLESQGQALEKALSSEPGDPFFEQLAREIEERIRPERPKSSSTRAVPAPEAPAARMTQGAGATAAPPAHATRGLMDDPSKPVEEEPPLLRPPEWDPGTVRKSASPLPWAAAFLTVILAVSAGVVLSRVGRIGPSPAAGPERTPPATATAPVATTAPGLARVPPGQGASGPETGSLPPSQSVGGTDVPTPDSESAGFEPVPTPGDEALVGPDGKLRRAKGGPRAAATARATAPAAPAARSAAGEPEPRPDPEAARLTALDYEASAARWEEDLPSLRGDDYRDLRLRVAEARYRAWEVEPNADRAARAEAAIRAYLVTAPKSDARDEAARWLSRVEEAGFR